MESWMTIEGEEGGERVEKGQTKIGGRIMGKKKRKKKKE